MNQSPVSSNISSEGTLLLKNAVSILVLIMILGSIMKGWVLSRHIVFQVPSSFSIHQREAWQHCNLLKSGKPGNWSENCGGDSSFRLCMAFLDNCTPWHHGHWDLCAWWESQNFPVCDSSPLRLLSYENYLSGLLKQGWSHSWRVVHSLWQSRIRSISIKFPSYICRRRGGYLFVPATQNWKKNHTEAVLITPLLGPLSLASYLPTLAY